jgi:anti-sigma factor RsiW
MNINLNNYEAYFLDYHEGKLAPEQVAELMSFLEEHPELKEMFYEFDNVSLTDLEEFGHNIKFEEKDSLKKEVFITQDSLDDLLAGAVEGVLDEEERDTLEQLLKADPKVKQNLDLYRKTIITADHSEVFEGKEDMKRLVLINAENCSQYLSASIDNELNALEQKELDRFLLANPAMQAELELLRKTKLSPDLSVVYENKEELKHGNRKVIALWYYAAAAAAVALLMGLFFMLNKPEPAQPYASNTPSKKDQPSVNDSNSTDNNNVNAVANNNVPSNNSGVQSSQPVNTPVASNQKKKKAPLKNDRPVKKDDLAPQDQQPVIVNNNKQDDKDKKNDLITPITPNNEELASNEVINERFDAPEEDMPSNTSPAVYTLRDVAVSRLKTGILKEEADAFDAPNKVSGWDIVAVALRGIRKVSGKSTGVEKVYSEDGEVVAYNVQVGNWGFTRNRGK